ncbi:hypothetical protein [Histidinibacterium aquaticum]|nr:hypothetical protein [Histidinibacterium aquaticum]
MSRTALLALFSAFVLTACAASEEVVSSRNALSPVFVAGPWDGRTP